MSERGKYLNYEGADGTGKSTQVKITRAALEKIGIESIEFHEPEDETLPITSEIRRIIKNGDLARDPLTNVMLFTAARNEIWRQHVQPALKLGVWVVGSRSWLSTMDYQGYGEGVDLDLIESVTHRVLGQEYMNPDGEIILSIDDLSVRRARIENRGHLETPDTFESKPVDFQERLALGYGALADNFDIPVVDAVGTPEEVQMRIVAELRRQIPDFPL